MSRKYNAKKKQSKQNRTMHKPFKVITRNDSDSDNDEPIMKNDYLLSVNCILLMLLKYWMIKIKDNNWYPNDDEIHQIFRRDLEEEEENFVPEIMQFISDEFEKRSFYDIYYSNLYSLISFEQFLLNNTTF